MYKNAINHKLLSIFSVLFAFIFVLGVNSVKADNLVKQKDSAINQTNKVLYLHVGTHKTASTSIQEECTKNRANLKELGILYPEPVNIKDFPTNHHSIAHLVIEGDFNKLKDYVANVKEQSKDYDSVLMSSEVFAHIALDPNFESFLKLLRENFNVKIVYVDREFSDRVADLASYIALVGGMGGVPFPAPHHKSIDDFIAAEKEKNDKVKEYFASQGAVFYSFEDLKKDKKLVSTFLDKALGVKLDIPNKFYNKTEELAAVERSKEDLLALDVFYNVPAGTFSKVWEESEKPGKAKFATLILKLTKERADAFNSSPVKTAEK